MNLDCLRDIPDPQGLSFDTLKIWIDQRLIALRACSFTPEMTLSFTPCEWHEEFSSPFGVEASPTWRRFFIAVLLADWACYDVPLDRIDYARLQYIMTSAAPYMRAWFCRLPDGQMTPVGYTGGYPISKMIYDAVREDQSCVDDRGVFLPRRFLGAGDVHKAYAVYGLNISIIPQLRNTLCSRRMIRAFQRDAAMFKDAKILAITVDVAGQRFAKLTKLNHMADVDVQGHREGLFIRV